MLETAELLLTRSPAPKASDLCRAISTIYYALFSEASKWCADLFAGNTADVIGKPAWMQAYRCLEHRTVFARCGERAALEGVDASILDFAYQLSLMQHHRYLSDYSFGYNPPLSTVQDYLKDAKSAIVGFQNAPDSHKRQFLVHVAIKSQYHKTKEEPKKS